MKLLVTLLLVVALLVAVGCAEREEDWTHAEAYFECFFGAYQPYLEGLAAKNDEAIAEAVIHARKQCHVPSRGALKSAEAGDFDANKTCILQAEQLMATKYGDRIDLDSMGGWRFMLESFVCKPDLRVNPHLDGSEAS